MLVFNSLARYIVVSLGIQMKMHSYAFRWHHCTRWNKITMKHASLFPEQSIYLVSSACLGNHNAGFWNRKMMCRKIILILGGKKVKNQIPPDGFYSNCVHFFKTILEEKRD